MARITYGSLVSDVSGSIGSATFQKSSFGNTLRNKPLPRKSCSSSQLSMRNLMVQLHQAWAAMTSEQRTAWNRFVSFSMVSIKRDRHVLLTGHSLFLKYNFLRLLSGLTVLEDFSFSLIDSFPLPAGISNDAGSCSFRTEDNFDSELIWAVVKLSSPQRSSKSFDPGSLRYISTPWVDTVTSALSIETSYAAVYGAVPPVDAYIHYSVQFFSYLAPVVSQKLSGIFVVYAP